MQPNGNGAVRPALPAQAPAYPSTPYGGQANPRAGAYQGYALPNEGGRGAAQPQGHLGSWLDTRRNVPVEQQERDLRNDPAFKRLTPADQQRLIGQLHQVNQLTPEQQQRRLGRMEMLERLSPEERMQVNQARQRLNELSPDRKQAVAGAFRDLRSVPYDQRQTVLNSSRYQGAFSPEERGILGNILRVEPYEPVR